MVNLQLRQWTIYSLFVVISLQACANDSANENKVNASAAFEVNFCDDELGLRNSLIEGRLLKEIEKVSTPEKGQSVVDPAFGTCITRATDHKNEPPVGFARNDYSRRQAFNADNTKFIIYANNGHWHLYDTNTLRYIKQLNGPAADAELQWHPNDPQLLYYLPNTGGMTISVLNVDTNTSKIAASFYDKKLPWQDVARVWTRSEGSPSADTRFWGLLAETQDYQPLGLLIYDMQEDKVISTWDIDAKNVGRPDHVSMSPSGEFIVASWDGGLGTVAFDKNFSKQVKLHHKSEHSDLALLDNGNDAYVSIDYQSAHGDVFMVEIQTGNKTVLFPTYIDGTATAIHFSGKAFSRPGWVLVSTYGPVIPTGKSVQWLHDKVFAVELASNPKILNIAHHRANTVSYFSEPHASTNQDFTKILVNSNWGQENKLGIDAYLIKVPSGFDK